MKRTLVAAAAAATVAMAGPGSASAAAGQALCVGTPSGAVASPDPDGVCKKGTAVTLVTADDVAALEARVGELEAANADLHSEVAALEHKLSAVSYDARGLDGKPTVKIDGANLQITDGSGNTAGSLNGLGNLFIGYNEQRSSDEQTGSHNLVLGSWQTFTSYGGLVAGFGNRVTGPNASALGSSNTASGARATVSGGSGNTAAIANSSVSGGNSNTASGVGASVSGGIGNTAESFYASVSGGRFNAALGRFSSILGGSGRTVNTEAGTSP